MNRVGAALAVGLALLPSAAIASPLPMSAEQLAAGSDAIATARVVAVSARWAPGNKGLVTRVELERVSVEMGQVARRFVIEQPGGALDGARHIVFGMPQFSEGEVVRVHLRRTGATYRVYGWELGKHTVVAPPVPSTTHFELNNFVWEPAQMPVPILFHQDGSDDVAFAAARAAVWRAFDRWQSVPCSTLTYEDAGDTDLDIGVDGIQVVRWIESGWAFGEEAAGAASLFIMPGETPTADIALNGEHFSWADGVPSVGPATQDIEGVMTHEIGHVSGVSHSMRSIDTMYFSWTPWQSQRTLSADDKLAVCSIYPAPAVAHECDMDTDCDEGAICETFDSGRLCSPQPDPIGADCGSDRVECGDFCLYTTINLSTGYCSRFCDDTPCPPEFECMDASSGSMPVRVCFRAATCDDDTGCAADRHCGASGICTFECREDIDCPGGTCDDRSRCELTPPDDSGCGCQTSGSRDTALACLLVLFALLRRRRVDA